MKDDDGRFTLPSDLKPLYLTGNVLDVLKKMPDEVVQTVSRAAQKTLLEQSFLGQGLLCGHGWFGFGDDHKMCLLPGEKGKTTRAVKAGRIKDH